MKVHEYREMMRYLTRKPAPRISTQVASSEGPETDYQTEVQPDMVVPPQDVLPKNAEPVMPSAPGIPNPQSRQLELATGGVVNRENYGLGSDFIKDLYKTKIPGIDIQKAANPKYINIRGRYTNKNGERIIVGSKTFRPETTTQKEVTDFLNQMKKQTKGKIYSFSESAQISAENKKKYSNLKKKYTIEVMDWLDEASNNPKYKNREQIQKDLFKQFNQPKYTQVPEGIQTSSIFFKDNGINIPREMEIFGKPIGSTSKYRERVLNNLTDFFLFKNNPNFEKVRDAAYGFFTQKKADINKYPAEQQKILRSFSKEFVKTGFKGEGGESLFIRGLKQEGFNFNNKVNEVLYIKSLAEKIKEELNNPTISNNRKNFLNKQLEAINYQKTNIIKNLTQTHPNLFKMAKHPGNLVYEHKVPRFIQDIINLPYDYLARASFAPNAFNMYKLDQFDKPLGKLISEYNSTNDVTVKNEIKNKIEDLKNTFNKKTKVNGQGYLDDVEFKFGNKVKLIDNTPLISDLTNKNVYENILRNVGHSNKFFENEGLNKYIVKGKDFEKYTKDLQNRISINKGAYYSFPAQVSESTLFGTLAGKAKDVFSNAYSAYKYTGGPLNTLIGGILNAPEMEEKGLSTKEALAYGGIKATVEDSLNFAAQILAAGPLMQKTLLEAAKDVKQQPPAGIDSFDQIGGKQGLQSKFFNELFSVQPFDISEIPLIGSTWLAEQKPTKERIDNLVNLKTRQKMAELYPAPSISETEVPVQDNIMQQQEQEIKKNLYQEYFKNPLIKQEYEKPEPVKAEPTSNLMLGPITFPRYSEQELNLAYGGRVKFAEGTEEDDLYIPPLDKPSGTEIPKEGLRGLYYGFKDEPRNVPIDPATGEPIKSGGIKELKQILSSSLPEKRPEIGYANERFNISASKSINPFDKDRDTKYQASYQPDKDSGSFLIEKTPNYTAGGYGYNKDGLSYGISGLVDKMGNKNISARIKYDFATGGRVNFSGGGRAAIKLARMITDVLGDLREKLFMPAHTQRTTGAKEAKELATRPYTHPANQSRQSNILEGIEKSKTLLPEEYHSILDDIKKDVENFNYATASNRADALNNQIPDALNFEKLSKDLFPMLDPLNDAFIIFDPKREKMMSRYTHKISINPETGRGTRETYDVWDSQKQRFNEGFEEKLIGVESLEKGKEGLN